MSRHELCFHNNQSFGRKEEGEGGADGALQLQNHMTGHITDRTPPPPLPVNRLVQTSVQMCTPACFVTKVDLQSTIHEQSGFACRNEMILLIHHILYSTRPLDTKSIVTEIWNATVLQAHISPPHRCRQYITKIAHNMEHQHHVICWILNRATLTKQTKLEPPLTLSLGQSNSGYEHFPTQPLHAPYFIKDVTILQSYSSQTGASKGNGKATKS